MTVIRGVRRRSPESTSFHICPSFVNGKKKLLRLVWNEHFASNSTRRKSEREEEESTTESRSPIRASHSSPHSFVRVARILREQSEEDVQEVLARSRTLL